MAEQKSKKKSEFVRVMKQLSKNKLAMIGLVIFVLEVLIAIFAPLIAPYDYTARDFMAIFSSATLCR